VCVSLCVGECGSKQLWPEIYSKVLQLEKELLIAKNLPRKNCAQNFQVNAEKFCGWIGKEKLTAINYNSSSSNHASTQRDRRKKQRKPTAKLKVIKKV